LTVRVRGGEHVPPDEGAQDEAPQLERERGEEKSWVEGLDVIHPGREGGGNMVEDRHKEGRSARGRST
jgi:hypothetical protein